MGEYPEAEHWHPYEVRVAGAREEGKAPEDGVGQVHGASVRRGKAKRPRMCRAQGCENSPDQQKANLCPTHARARSVFVSAGNPEPVRFCQSCKCLHLLSAFDANRRSCRDALEKVRKRSRLNAAKRKSENYPFPATTHHQPHRSAPDSSAFHPAQPASSTSAPVSTPSGSAFAQFVPVQPVPSRSQDSIHAPELVQQPMPASRSLPPSRTFPLSQRFEQATPMMKLDMWNSGLASQSPQGGQEAQFDLASSTSPELRTLFAKLDAAGPHDLSTSV